MTWTLYYDVLVLSITLFFYKLYSAYIMVISGKIYFFQISFLNIWNFRIYYFWYFDIWKYWICYFVYFCIWKYRIRHFLFISKLKFLNFSFCILCNIYKFIFYFLKVFFLYIKNNYPIEKINLKISLQILKLFYIKNIVEKKSHFFNFLLGNSHIKSRKFFLFLINNFIKILV